MFILKKKDPKVIGSNSNQLHHLNICISMFFDPQTSKAKGLFVNTQPERENPRIIHGDRDCT